MWNEQPKIRIEKRIEILLWIFLAAFAFLVIRLWYLSILETALYQQKSEMNRIRITSLPAPRGNIYDRYGKILAQDMPHYAVSYLPENLEMSDIVSRLERVIGRSIDNLPRERPSGEILLIDSITFEEVIRIEEAKQDLPGIMVEVRPSRVYPGDDTLSHIIGYIGSIGKEELREKGHLGYGAEDLIGKSGIELYYEEVLRGEKGYRRIEVDALGKIVRMLDVQPPRFNNSLVLTVDYEFQKFGHELLQGKRGVIVAGKPQTGEILVMATYPAFSPNRLVQGLTHEEWTRLIEDPRQLFHNQSLQSLHPPGSIFKPLLALGALEENLVDGNQRIFCPGYFDYNEFRYHCWRRSGHGALNLVEAIAVSCNIFFFHLGLKIGPVGINRWAANFLLNSGSGIDLPGEKISLFPDARWKRQRFAERWFPGDTLNYSIGQGYLLMTPFSMYRLIAGIATRGTLYQPHLLKQIITNDGTLERVNTPKVVKKLTLKDSTWHLVQEGMRQAVRNGTAQMLGDLPVAIAGKTGTAQNPHGEDHSWFGGFFPADNPEIVLLVFIEHGGDGSGIATRITRSMIEWYLTHRGGRL
ncbi:MAG TPA: penicillin-binding protein 2 [Atribacteraceae bacterium]|nr:penicillin-binding protein 2 [Atribacteraceae bacterium]